MNTLIVLAVIAALVGIIGSIIPGLPGPPISCVGIFLAYLGGLPITRNALFVWIAVTTVVTLMDYVIPSMMTRFLGGHKAASTGAIIGLFAGMFFTPVGMITGSIVCAFAAEMLFEGTSVWGSMKAALGAFLGFFFGTGLKLIVAGWMFYEIVSKAIALL